MLRQIWELIPHRLFYFLIGGLVLSYVGSYILNYLTNFNNRKISELKSEIENIKSQYSENFRTDSYQALMQFLSLKYLVDQKKSIIPLIQQPPQYLPKFLKINEVSFEKNKNYISLSGQVEGWLNYSRLVKYFEKNSNIFKEFKINSFSFDNSTGLISLNISFIFNPQ
ncbi:MAG: hypothetical protein NZ866_01950 [Patescibacteria group bacterium]|nr:hypothetical protein [Patescibacteria group bacterium]